jgi:cytochrome c5
MSQEQDQIFFRNFSLALAAIAVMMVLFFVAANFVVDDDDAQAEMRADKVAGITKPIGEAIIEGQEEIKIVAVDGMAEAPTAASADGDVGQQLYEGLCVNCHGIAAMAAMIPQYGDKAAWVVRIEKGLDTLYDNAIKGFMGDMGMMPAKGGNPALSDDDVKAAVDYIVQSVQ